MHDPVLAGNSWHSAASARREEGAEARGCRRRSDVSVLLTHDGRMVEWSSYDPYGPPAAQPAGDTNADFAWDADDQQRIEDFIENGGTYDVRFDTTLDGTVTAADITHANSITGGYQTLGRGVLSSAGVKNRIGYAGYVYDSHLAGAERHLYHPRNRVYRAEQGRFQTRDPLGYVQGMNLYQYVLSQPILRTDPSGLLSPPPNASWGHGCGSACGTVAQPSTTTPPYPIDDDGNPIGPPPTAPPVPPDGDTPYPVDDDGNPIPVAPPDDVPAECPPPAEPPSPGIIDTIVCWIGPDNVLYCTGGPSHIPGIDKGPTQTTIVICCSIVSVAAPGGAVLRVVTCGGRALRTMKESSVIVRRTRMDRIRRWIRYDRPHHGKPAHWDGIIPNMLRRIDLLVPPIIGGADDCLAVD